MTQIRTQIRNQVGLQAEQFTADYLEAHNWQILSRRYRSRWGELDLVARQGDTLSFVEVKARRAQNWDSNGLLSITPSKQRKLWLTALDFLRAWPHLEPCHCRFDVVLVEILPTRAFRLVEYHPDAFALNS
jgi:putative endonuclease